MSIARCFIGTSKVTLSGLKLTGDVLLLLAAIYDQDDETLKNLFLINKGLDFVNLLSNICTHTGDDLLEIGEGIRSLKGIGQGIAYGYRALKYGTLGSAAAKGCAIADAVYDCTFGLANSFRFFQTKSTETVTPPAGYAPLAGVEVKKMGQ